MKWRQWLKNIKKKLLPDLPTPYEVQQTFTDSIYWRRVESIKGNQPFLKQEKFIEQIEQKNPEIFRFFQDRQPSSQRFLLHEHPPLPGSPQKEVPVLLVHGASHHANLSWCKSLDGEKGLLFPLIQAGYHVFAVTFAHPHGENKMQGIQVFNALRRIKELTGTNQVDVIAHSKGGVPTRLYASNFLEMDGAPYEGNIRKYIMLGTPNKGIDFVFRNVTANYGVIQKNISAPVACDSLMYFGSYMDTTSRSIYADGGAFPGQSQLLYRWDDKYPIPPENRTLYYGGQTMLYHSRGIDAALIEGDYLIEKMLGKPVHPGIELYALAGNNPFFKGIPGEQSGKSDGLVLVDSVLEIEPMASRPSQIKKAEEESLNHLELLYHQKAHQWVLSALEE
jgi:triacylglycerol lipase